MRVRVGEEFIDLRGLVVQAPVESKAGGWECVVAVRWSDGLRLRAEAMTRSASGGDDDDADRIDPGDSALGARNPSVDVNVTDSVPPFWLTPPDPSTLPGGGEEPSSRSDGARDPGATPLPSAVESAPPDWQPVSVSAPARAPAPPRSARAQRMLEDAHVAEAAGDLVGARRFAVLALAYEPTDGQLRDMVERLEARLAAARR